ncbi:hypothetical protein NDU88_003528 [Pleurodeles waltl]|uniref:Uncharacterized protein n=1 Tax=Pleurodeles waltl TaxID=8319 RepID=A0AAV7RHP0_PLEWA|nr:hypothetical protein NDU88_003528 [Pleurodeles waltl]
MNIVLDVVIGDKVIMKDQHPGWKFLTPFDQELREVVNNQGTTITVQQGLFQLSRNVPWFKQIGLLAKDQGDCQEAVDKVPEINTAVPSPQQDVKHVEPGHAVPAPGVASPRMSTNRSDMDTNTSLRQQPGGRSQKYGLRPNPIPSQD